MNVCAAASPVPNVLIAVSVANVAALPAVNVSAAFEPPVNEPQPVYGPPK